MNAVDRPQKGATATEVISYVADRIIEPYWQMTFADYDTSPKFIRENRPDTSSAWRLSWGGLVQEAQEGDLDALLNRITLHTKEIEERDKQIIQREAVAEWLNRLPTEYPPNGNLSALVCSRVEYHNFYTGVTGPWIKHITMMDFRSEPSERGLDLVIRSMEKLGQKNGLVLESGQSYHYIGFDLMSEEEWRDFMLRSLLLTPFVDPRYIGHRLLANTSRLRLTASTGKPVVPTVVASLGSS